MDKRKQTLTPAFIAIFNPPFAIPLIRDALVPGNASVSKKCRRLLLSIGRQRVEKMPLNIIVYSGMREPLACRSAC